ncbi:MAG: site-specific DNA-methyltransferase [Archangium gephyra]|uniref:site-specific DNA-methyltransferase (adenine-specific) n=1 Tax=Archangium gephyra TaxID=48 RepID=A0A2W5UM75_9BACT|nr:MAG: site-specific DNA-methyltransferase [Archangium gephyra]
MSPRLKRLELTWIGKDDEPRLEPRILLEDEELSYAKRVSSEDIFENRLVHGDNLLALKALEQEFAGKVQCIYIDPPFNTGQAFEHYNDGLEHSIWLDLMFRRVEVMRGLLRPGGVLFVHLDQEEVHYMKVVLDEVFGRPQFLGQIAYERSGASGIGMGGAFLVNTHEYVLAYVRDRSQFVAADLSGEGPLEPKAMKRYNQIMVSPGERKEVARFTAPSTGEPVVIYKHDNVDVRTVSLRAFDSRRQEIDAEYVANFEKIFRLTSNQKENEFQNRIMSHCKDGFFSADYLVSRGRKEGEQATYYYIDEQAVVWLKDTATLVNGQIVRTGKLSDFWTHADIPKANLANEGGVDFRRGKKPELLIRRLLKLVTKPGDWVLDSFAGSGTTGAVAHKMGRRWIMVELGEHCKTHILPRLRSIVDGVDGSGATDATGWRGGGGFHYFNLAPSLLEKDKWGNWIVSKQYKPEMLAEAMCKLEGFRYEPDREAFWKHGHSSERDFIFVTTQNLSSDQLRFISEKVGPERTLLICCGAFRGKHDFSNLTVKKIPQAVLSRCEWGKDDYSLNVTEQAPVVAVEEAKALSLTSNGTNTKTGARRKKAAPVQALPLFAGIDDGSK